MSFENSVNYLLSLGNEVSAMKLGLENIRKLLAALNDPQNNFLKVQVAGTNGKGSTCVFLDSICREAGINTGLYTSPHLISITERIKINGVAISESDFARHAAEVRKIAEGEFDVPPTFFEQVTAIALRAFAEAKIELAILETGLGGRLDATTAADAEIAAITPIDFDHQQYLGETLAEIAAEKAAIIHKGSKVVVAPQKPEAQKVIMERCEEFGIHPIFSASELPAGISLKMTGRHQRVNAALAISVAKLLQQSDPRITGEAIFAGLEKAAHHGRMEYVDGVLLDGAHNLAGAGALAAYLDEFITRPITLIFGAMNDKNISGIAQILFPRAKILILTAANNSRSALHGDLLKLVPESFPKHNVFTAQNVIEAFDTAKKITYKDNTICVTGSLYLVGEALKLLQDRIEQKYD
jgi:dihydrofolate synthase/folylpolyglutamate synthase